MGADSAIQIWSHKSLSQFRRRQKLYPTAARMALGGVSAVSGI